MSDVLKLRREVRDLSCRVFELEMRDASVRVEPDAPKRIRWIPVAFVAAYVGKTEQATWDRAVNVGANCPLPGRRLIRLDMVHLIGPPAKDVLRGVEAMAALKALGAHSEDDEKS